MSGLQKQQFTLSVTNRGKKDVIEPNEYLMETIINTYFLKS